MQQRDDIVPVILGGDSGVYALGREFHEAFGVKCVCVASGPIAAIAYSKIFTVEPVPILNEDTILSTLTRLSQKYAEKKLVLMANTDALISFIANIKESLPRNVCVASPSKALIKKTSDKLSFMKLCQSYGLATPVTCVLDPHAPFNAPSISYPCIAKPQESSAYADYLALGFKKVYYLTSESALKALKEQLAAAEYPGTFLIQQLIRGDDTYMDSITVYIDKSGHARMLGGAQVLLEDHAPSMLGNPVAMITRTQKELFEKVAAMLCELDWVGFANFDIKRDPKTGTPYFLEMNPRIGRNSYYNVAAGVNPMQVLVSDIIDHAYTAQENTCLTAEKKALYLCGVSASLVQRYLSDPELADEVRELLSEGRVADPLRYKKDRSLKRSIAVALTRYNQRRKFARYYPAPTETSF